MSAGISNERTLKINKRRYHDTPSSRRVPALLKIAGMTQIHVDISNKLMSLCRRLYCRKLIERPRQSRSHFHARYLWPNRRPNGFHLLDFPDDWLYSCLLSACSSPADQAEDFKRYEGKSTVNHEIVKQCHSVSLTATTTGRADD